MDGLLVVDKPVGPTSHDIVARVRRALNERRVGHTGTLDPAASGVLPLVVGKATRLARFLSASEKAYDATIRLGFATDTCDAQGQPVGEPYAGPLPTAAAIDAALARFRGTFEQRPPLFSAKKVDGVRSYRRARAGVRAGARPGTEGSGPGPGLARAWPGPDPGDIPAPAAVTVSTTSVEILAIDGALVTLSVTCSAGFYVRSLARDLGEQLGTGAHLTALRRTRAGELTLADAVPLDADGRDGGLAERVTPMAAMLPALPALTLTDQGERRVADGRDLRPDDLTGGAAPAADGPVRLFDRAGHLVAIADARPPSGLLHPSIVLR